MSSIPLSFLCCPLFVWLGRWQQVMMLVENCLCAKWLMLWNLSHLPSPQWGCRYFPCPSQQCDGTSREFVSLEISTALSWCWFGLFVCFCGVVLLVLFVFWVFLHWLDALKLSGSTGSYIQYDPKYIKPYNSILLFDNNMYCFLYNIYLWEINIFITFK